MPEPCQAADPNPRAPKLLCPPGAADCHFHIYGPPSQFPPSPTARFIVPDALPSACRHLHDVLGIERVVVVQPSGYGFDNRRQLSALAEFGRPGRAVVALPFDVSEDEIDRMHQAGARGARFTVGLHNSPSFDDIARFGERLVRRQWHVELNVLHEQGLSVLSRGKPILENFPVTLVIAHIATIDAPAGTGQEDFQALCDLVRGGGCWVKLSAGNRLTPQPPPYKDVIPFVQTLVALRPDRLVWGTDWPHVNFKRKMPNTTEMLDCLLEWVPDETARHQILVDNPQLLYGF